ncbi:TPA: oligosaccharide flippase family protein [Photobacterium damselae]
MSLLKNTSVYIFSNILNAAIPFTLLPVLTRYLSPYEYGKIAMFQLLIIALNSIVGLNTGGAATRKYYDGGVDENTLKEFNGSCIQILFVSFVFVFAFVFVFKNQLSDFLSIPSTWIYLSVLISFFGYILSLRLGQWQIRENPKAFGILQISNSLFNMLLSLFFVIIFNQGAEGRISALFLTGVIFFIVSFLFLYKDDLLKVFVWKPNYIKEALSFGIPIIPHALGVFLITSVDRVVINDKLGLNEAGIYIVAVQLSSSLSILFDAFNKAYVPWLFSKLKKNDDVEKKKIVKFTYLYFFAVLFMSLLSFVIGPLVIKVLTSNSYSGAEDIIGWLCLGQVFGGMYLMVTNYIFYSKKTGVLGGITLFTGIINIILLYILISGYGLIGAAVAFAISKFIQFIITWFFASKCVEMRWFS